MVAYIALIITGVGVIGALIALRQNYRQRLRQFEEMYVQRYWAISDRLSLATMSSNAPGGQVDESDEKAIRAYIRLCEDEMEVRAEGWISDTTYAIWARAICIQMKMPGFAQVWQRVREESIFPYTHLERLLNSCEGKLYDPCQMRIWHRRLHGLAGTHGV